MQYNLYKPNQKGTGCAFSFKIVETDKEGNKVNFTKDSEYEFIINDEKLYRMRANDICTILN